MISQQVNNDAVVGTGMAIAGSFGLTLQFVTQFASMTAAVLNVVLAVGGLYLLWLKIRRSRQINKRSGQ